MKRTTGTALILALGTVSLAYLLTLVRDTVFFSGDGGMKFILVQHFASGNLAPLVKTGAPEWVNTLWHEGFFPFDPPFGYEQQAGMFVAYPLYFPLLTAPFYALLGWRGLYVWPVLAVIGTWFVVLRALRLAHVSKWAEWFGLAALVFSTPLSLYGAMFWEHTLSVFFVAFTLPYIVRSLDGSIRWPIALALGTLAALSVFFRAETGALLLITAAAGLWINGRARWKASIAYGVGLGLGVASFLLANQLAYGIATGVHSLQLLEQDLWSVQRVRDMLSDVGDMLPRLLATTPLLVAALVALPVAWIIASGRPLLRRQITASTAIVVAVFLCTPILLPSDGHKQWGARFYLILLPWAAMLFSLVVDALVPEQVAEGGERAPARVSRGWRYAAGGLMVAALIWGFLYNGLVGVRTLRDDYANRVLPALEEVRALPVHTVIVSHQWIAQELASLYFDRDFYWVRPDEDDKDDEGDSSAAPHEDEDERLQRLLSDLRAHGESEALYITYQPGSNTHRPIDFGEFLGQYGTYWVYRLR